MPRALAFLIFPGFQLLDAAGPLGAFEMTAREPGPAHYRLSLVSRQGGLVESSSGAGLMTRPFNDAGEIDTLVVSGGLGTYPAVQCAETVGFIRRTAETARRTTSVCSGAYLLAAAGLLDGRRATTHWSRGPHFARAFPRVRLEPDRIFVRDGPVWTSAGVTAGIDLALALIADDLGEAAARRAAQQLVVYRRRPGGQSQFSALLELERPDGRFGPLVGWMRERLGEPLTVERLAEQAAMSPRNFARAFAAETGMTPAKAVERLRLEAAREWVEAGAEPIDRIARRTGFADPERMRRAFLRGFGQPPQALRRAARSV